MSYLLEAAIVNKKPKSDIGSGVKLEIAYDHSTTSIRNTLGKIQKQTVKLLNLSGKPQGMSLASLSIPSCMTIELSQLELLKNKGDIDNYEFSADNTILTLYWTYLGELEEKKITLSRVVSYRSSLCQGRASRAFLYYDNDKEAWVE